MSLRRRRWTRLAAVGFLACALLAPAAVLRAEEPAPTVLTIDQLKQLVGPVALYPDAVLASLLPATTFPLDVVAASRWLDTQKGPVKSVPEGTGWDASVVALLQFPDVIKWLDENLPWMEQMGAAVTNQQAGVLQAIQDFRREAKAAGNLKTDEHMVVKEVPPAAAPEGTTVQVPAGTTVIVCEPVSPEVVYIPVYDPYVVLRPWGGYPVFDWGIGIGFGVGGFWGWHDISWGWWNWGLGIGWWGGIYASPSWWYWGVPHPSGWWYGPSRPHAWYSSHYYPPRHDGHDHHDGYGWSAKQPRRMHPVDTRLRSGTATSGLRPPTTLTGRSWVRSGTPPPTLGGTTLPKGSYTRRSLPTTGTGLSTGLSGTRRVTGADGAVTGTSTVRRYGHDLSGDRGRSSLVGQGRTYTPRIRSTTSTPRVYTPSRTTSSFSSRARISAPYSSSRATLRTSTSQTRAWSTRGHGSIQSHSTSRSYAPRRSR